MSADTTGILQLASNNGTVAVTVDTSQNFCIGTTSASGRLTVTEPTNADAVISLFATQASRAASLNLNGTIAGYNWLNSNTSGTLDWRVGGGAGSATLTFCTGSSGTERMRIDSSGNVFVGGTTQNTANKPVYSSTTAKSWVKYNLSTQTVNASYNVSSVTYNGSGTFTVNFTNALTDANYVNVTGMKLITDVNTNVQTTTQSTSNYQVVVSNPGINNYNQLVYVATFGN
jgi:hypothetical protein